MIFLFLYPAVFGKIYNTTYFNYDDYKNQLLGDNWSPIVALGNFCDSGFSSCANGPTSAVAGQPVQLCLERIEFSLEGLNVVGTVRVATRRCR